MHFCWSEHNNKTARGGRVAPTVKVGEKEIERLGRGGDIPWSKSLGDKMGAGYEHAPCIHFVLIYAEKRFRVSTKIVLCRSTFWCARSVSSVLRRYGSEDKKTFVHATKGGWRKT